MGAKDKRKKPPTIVDAEITDDGCIIITMNQAFKMGNSKKIMLPPETLFSLGEEYASMPPASETDYPGVPVIEEADVFSEAAEDEAQGEEEDEPEQEM